VEAVVLVGLQASGKSTLYRERFFETHVRLSQDLLRTRHRQERFLQVCLETRMPFVLDKVNATAAERRPVVQRARAAGFRVVAFLLATPPRVALERNAARPDATRVPVAGLLGTAKRLEPPRAEEGFDAVHVVGG
jgi:predicted kinase